MITFILVFALGAIFGATGLICVAIMYDNTQTNRKEQRYADKE